MALNPSNPRCKQQLDLEVEATYDADLRLMCSGCGMSVAIPTDLPTVMFIVQAARQFKHSTT